MLYGDRRRGLAGAALLKQRRRRVGGFYSEVLTYCQSCSLHTQTHTENAEVKLNTSSLMYAALVTEHRVTKERSIDSPPSPACQRWL